MCSKDQRDLRAQMGQKRKNALAVFLFLTLWAGEYKKYRTNLCVFEEKELSEFLRNAQRA